MENLSDLPAKQTFPGFFGKMIHGDASTIAFWDIKKDSHAPEHHHVHEQITYLVEGNLEMTIGGVQYLLTPGSVHVIPSDVLHSAHALTDCRVIDTFVPVREDYR